MNGWGQFFLGVLALVVIAGVHRRSVRYQIVKRLIEANHTSQDIVDVMESLNRGNIIERYVDSDDRG